MCNYIACFRICSEQVKVKDSTGNELTCVLIDNLDQGGFSKIDLVSTNARKGLFVMKRIVCHSIADEEKALNEAHQHLNLKPHPNLLKCIGIGRTLLRNHPQGAHCEISLMLDYYPRGTLQHELDRRIRRNCVGLPFEVAIQILKGVCNALFVLQSLDIPLAHRDIKPGNVLLSDDWCPVLMDFGSVTTSTIEIRSHREVECWKDFAAENCSMAYRAPELFQPQVGQCITFKADIWSLGCLFYAILYLESPFDYVHKMGNSIALAVCSPPVHLPHDTSHLPPEALNLIRSMLSVEPNSRPTLSEVVTEVDLLESVFCNKNIDAITVQPKDL